LLTVVRPNRFPSFCPSSRTPFFAGPEETPFTGRAPSVYYESQPEHFSFISILISFFPFSNPPRIRLTARHLLTRSRRSLKHHLPSISSEFLRQLLLSPLSFCVPTALHEILRRPGPPSKITFPGPPRRVPPCFGLSPAFTRTLTYITTKQSVLFSCGRSVS